MNLLWGNSVALSWMWGLGLFFSVQFSLQYGLFGLLTFAIPGISIGGHLGGLLAGAAAGAVLHPVSWPQQGAALRSTVVVGFAFTLGAFALAAAAYFTVNPLF